MSAVDEIKHVIVLILENHSFDQMLGCMSAVYPDLDGIDPNNLRSNADGTNPPISQKETGERMMVNDPHHEVEHVAMQLSNGNSGFVQNFVKMYPASSHDDRQNIMGYYRLDSLPALHPLARNFTVCDKWHSSLPGPTWPNRFFALSGTCLGKVDMPGDGTHKADLPGFFQQTQDTIFDRLTEKKIDWKVYFHDIPQSWVLKQQRAPHNAAQYYYMRRFYEDARGPVEDFPPFSLIEPDYMGFNQNDDHPPHDVMKAEKLIADVYNAIRANEALWKSTLLVVFYDEHGGFYDHVSPPAAVPPDEHVARIPDAAGPWDFKFDRLGLRAPALLISPWVKAGVLHTLFDRTSLLKFVQDKWQLRPLDSKRVAAAASFAEALDQIAPRTDTIPHIALTPEQLKPVDQAAEDAAVGHENELHQGMVKLTEYLSSALWEETKKEVVEGIPQIYSAVTRGIESVKQGLAASLDWLRGRCENGLAILYKTGDHEVVISSPDKIDLKYSGSRNRVVRFLATQKPRAVEGLFERMNDPGRSDEEIKHAARTLAAMMGRKFHHDRPDHVRAWLQRHFEQRQKD